MLDLQLPDHGAYCDLNVPSDNNALNNKNKVQMLISLGYDVIALSTELRSSTKFGKTKGREACYPQPHPAVVLDADVKEQLKRDQRKVSLLTRITIELENNEDAIKVRTVIQQSKFDIVAVRPKNDKMFLSCKDLAIDIICMNSAAEKLPFCPKANLVKMALERKVFFEFNYSPMIRDDLIMQRTISNALRIAEPGKGRNVLLSSGALVPMELRGPRDVANMSMLLGVPQNRAIESVQKNARSVIVHAYHRMTAKSATIIQYSPLEEGNKRTSDQDSSVPEAKKVKLNS